MEAYRAMQTSVNCEIIHNPTATKLWFQADGKDYTLAPGETIKL